MEWLVRPLHEAGFRVVALDHHGNNHVDGYERPARRLLRPGTRGPDRP
ncbi:hypothetical protein ACGFZL_28895 [Streptomyces sp. NPDC048182]